MLSPDQESWVMESPEGARGPVSGTETRSNGNCGLIQKGSSIPNYLLEQCRSSATIPPQSSYKALRSRTFD